jgi:hypothetical protein
MRPVGAVAHIKIRKRARETTKRLHRAGRESALTRHAGEDIALFGVERHEGIELGGSQLDVSASTLPRALLRKRVDHRDP